MSPTLLDRRVVAEMHARIDRLLPESDPRWGTMSAAQMVCHVADHLRVALGDTQVNPGKLALRFGSRDVAVNPGLLRFRPVRHLFVHRLPWPKARFRAPPEMWRTAPGEWREDIASLHALVDRVGDKPPAEPWGHHPWCGSISGPEWASICWRHLDYHLRQFGA